MIDKITRTAQDRHATRLSRLQSLLDEGGTNIDEDAAIARDKIWGKQQPALIRVRQGLVLRLGRDVSPIRAVATSKSAAVQLLLLAIFENQCRPVRRNSARTPIPLQDADQQTGTAWRHLVALPTTDRQSTKTQARSPEVNRVAQIKSALDRLKKLYRVHLNLEVNRGRYENFELLDEAANNRGGSISYKAPTIEEATIDIPVSFFMKGWIHALLDNEIIAYLFLLHQAKISPEQNSGAGMPLPRYAWAEAFGSYRAYESYRFLARFGLVQVQRDERRRANGTLRDFRRGAGGAATVQSHRFSIDTAALDRHALPVVADGLQGIINKDDLDKATGQTRSFFDPW
jgi:hypothetical protein